MILVNGQPYELPVLDRHCITCGADIPHGTLECEDGDHENRPSSLGYCNLCGRNSLSCECFDHEED